MDEVKKLFKEKNYVINTNILKNIKSLNITLDEFLLLLFFINEENVLDLDRINLSLGYSEEEILNIYSELLTKGLIEVKVSKIDGKVNETLSLDMFYDKLVLSIKNENTLENSDIYTKFEKEFGRPIAPIEVDMINKWIQSGISEETIESALKEAIINGTPYMKYIDRIIYEWTKKKRNNRNEEEDYQELFDYNWLGDNDE